MEIKKYFERNENTKYQTLRDAPKTVHWGKFIVWNAYSTKDLKSIA